MSTYHVSLFVTGLPHSGWFLQVPSFCLRISRFHYFFLQSSRCVDCHIFFIHSLVEGHLGYFQVLAITNNAAMNIVECLCCVDMDHLGIYLSVGFPGPVVD